MKSWVGLAAFGWALGAVAGCTGASASDAGLDVRIIPRDAPAPFDTPETIDASSDAPRTDAAAPDAPSPRDVGPDANWACSLVPEGGCADPLFTCRLSREPGTTPWVGPPACDRIGSRAEQENYPTGCFEGGRDLCGPELFCGHTVCYRYCVPGVPCPDGPRGDPQHCNTERFPLMLERWGVGYCSY